MKRRPPHSSRPVQPSPTIYPAAALLRPRRHAALIACIALASLACVSSLTTAVAETALVANSDLQADTDADGWPDGWGKVKTGGSWENEEGNRFIRLTSPSPGTMVMLYQEVPLPEGTAAVEVKWRQRITGLKKGSSPWFDARIMLEFADAERSKVGSAPNAPNTGKDTAGWEEKSTRFLIPDGAKLLKFMPCLFQVESGTFDLDDVVILSTDPEPIRLANEAAAAEKAAALAAKLAARQAKAAEVLTAHGTLMPGGTYEGLAKPGKNVVEEEGNHFLRLQTSEPGKMVMDYQMVDIPAGTPALELTWRHRVTGLKKGEKPWFDARIILEWKDAAGGKISVQPSAPFAQKDTTGWVEKSTSFLVPEGAATLVLMPSLFQANAGTYELDDFVLKPTDPAPILAKKADRERQAAARFVPDEAPDQSKWPKILKVVGNRLHDPDGKEVWLQGVNAGGLETLPQDDQPVKSLMVAIEDWKSNCIRIPIKDHFWYGKSDYQTDGGEAYRAKIAKMITLASNRGAYVAIDLHHFRAPKQEHGDFWKDFAALYKDHPAVLFDVFNEPFGITWEVWKDGGHVGPEKGVDESAFLTEEEKKRNRGFESIGMQGLVDAVRSTGAKNIIIAGGLFWCNDLTGVTQGFALDDKGGNGIMYSWHTYHWHKDWATRVVPAAEKYPIFLGEVGADTLKMGFIPDADQEDPYTWVPDMLGFIQKYKIHWTGWCFHPSATPRMILSWDYDPTPFWGEFAKQALAGKEFEMKKMR